MIRVCCLQNEIRPHFKELEKSCYDKGVNLESWTRPGKWWWMNKVRWQLEICKTQPDQWYVFIDAHDYLFLGEADELEGIVRQHPLRFSCDKDVGKGPWPIPVLEPIYNRRRKKLSPWCFVNGSGPAGHGKAIIEALEWGINNVPLKEPPETDQTFWTNVYLNGYGDLDQMCEMTQAFWPVAEGDFGMKDGRLHNLTTGTRPQFLHASGHSWAAIPDELLP